LSNSSQENKKRETFSSGLAVFFATLSSAVGLGNIWKFPYMVGENGGGAFILVYLICVALVGMPVAISEFFIGRRTRSNPVEAFNKLGSNAAWKYTGYLGGITGILVMIFYSAVAGWVYRYTFKAIRGDFSAVASMPIDEAGDFVSSQFGSVVGGDFAPIMWQLLITVIVASIIYAGVKNGIERVTKTLMPVLFILIVLCAVRSLMLEGSREGMAFLFNVDFSALSPSVVLAALGLAFFKLSLGMGTMITYGSYFTEDNNMPATSAKVALSDIGVSMLAGLAIFPVVFTFGLEPGEGPGLLFNTIPLVFSRIPFGNVLLVAFFLLASIAATTAMTSMFAVPMAILTEKFNMKKGKAVVLIAGTVFILGSLTVHPSSLLGTVTIAGKNFFDIYDFLSSNVFMPLGGLLSVMLVSRVVKRFDVYDELSNGGTLNNQTYLNAYSFLIRYVTPLLLVFIFLSTIGLLSL
jgi:neurotransmitter:Na+ symporter, NSS family